MSTSTRRSLRVLLVLVGALGAAMCVDGPTGPRARTPQPASFNLAPQWESSAHGAVLALADEGLPLDRVRIVIVRPEHDTLKDTTVAIHEGDPPLQLELNVTAFAGEKLDASIQFKSGETVLFEGGTTVTAQLLTAPGTTTPTPIAVVYVGPGATATTVAVSPATGTYPAIATIQFSASALADNGTVFPSTPFAWSVGDPTFGTITTNGLFTPSGKFGVVDITAETPKGLKGTATATLVSPVASIVIVSGDNQTAAVMQPLAQPLVVAARSANGAGVPGQTVTFAATDGGTVAPVTAVTGANGQAQTTLTVGTRIGAYNFTASSNGFTVGAKASATLGAATKMVIVGPAAFTVTSGVAPTNASSVSVVDGGDNGVPNITAQVDISIGTQSTSVSATSDANGTIAMPPSFALTAKLGVYTIKISNTALTGSPITFTVTVVAGAAAKLALATAPPATATSGTLWTPQPAVQIQDVNGNAVAQSGVVVTAAMTSGSGTLNGTLTATTVVSGLASFTGLSIAGPLGPRTLTFTATGLTSVTATTSIVTGTAAKLVLKVSPSLTVQSGVAFPVQPTIQLVDANDNPVAQSGVPITASQINLSGTTQVTTDASGAAAFTDLVLTGAPGTRSVGFAAPGTIASISVNMTLVVGPPASLTVIGVEQTAGVGTPVATPQGVKVLDSFGTPIQGVHITFAVAANSGTATGLNVITDAAGEARVISWTLGSVGANTMTASIDNSAIAAKTITATGTAAGAGVPVRIISVGTITQSGQVGMPLSPSSPSVKVVDINGNGVPGVVIAFAISGGGGTVPASQVVTSASGIATTPWTLGTFAGLNVLTATAMDTTATGVGFIGFTGGGTLHVASFAGNPVAFNAIGTPGPAAHMAMIVDPPHGSPGLSYSAPVKVTDAFGNGVTGISVKFAVKTDPELVVGSIDVDSTVTIFGEAGVIWTLSTTQGINQLSATVVGAGSENIAEKMVVFQMSTVPTGPSLARLIPASALLAAPSKKPLPLR
jgi:adhesin/invasin